MTRKDTAPHVTVTYGMRGWFAVLVSDSGDGFEPYQSGIGSYGTREGAEREAADWARCEGVEYRP